MTKKLKNYVAIVLDRSGSMDMIRKQTVDAFNSMVQTIQEKSQESGQETSVSLLTFGNNAKWEFFDQDVATLKPIGYSDFNPNGMTALFDGVGTTIDRLRQVADSEDENVSFLVITITDGGENASSRYDATQVNKFLKLTQSTDRWSYAFQLPHGQGKVFASQYGVPEDNIREWEATVKGVAAVSQVTNAAIGGYYTGRSLGRMSTKKFFDVTTDLSGVTPKTVHTKLDDISDRFTTLHVSKETAVKDFVEAETGNPYVIGSAYYQLTKSERVQPKKSILIMEKGKKAVWGGQQARDLIGLKDGIEARVTPGNHANYDIFIKSTSVNRKLVRGTKVLLDVKQKVGETPTWDHTAVAAK